MEQGTGTISRPRFAPEGQFMRSLRPRVAAVLTNRPPRGDPRVLRKAALILAGFLGSYALTLAAPSLAAYLAASALLAVFACAMAFNVFHDANHGTLFAGPRANLWASRAACVLLGVGRHGWRHKHHTLHHPHANLQGWDDDVESRGFLRLSPAQPWRPRFRGQHFSALPYYALNSVEWIYVKDFAQAARRRMNAHQPLPALGVAGWTELLACKALYAAAFLAVPLALKPVLWVLAGFAVFHLILSLVLTLVFQVAHLNQQVDFPTVSSPRIDEDWATCQLRTTANFAVDSRAITWFTGGLNHQIEHHLYPGLSHTYYPEISAVVRSTAAEHGLPYIVQPGLLAALRSHWQLLRRLSVPG